MDNILISMINASKLQRGEMKKESEASGDEFDKIFKDQFGDKAKKDRQDSARKTISHEESPKQKGPEDRADVQKKMQMKYDPENMTQFKKQNPLLATLLEANTRNLDTMSLRDKQAFKLDMFNNKAVDMKELEKMLAQKGLDINDLSYQEIAQLNKKHDRSQVLQFLDELIRQRRDSQKVQAAVGTQQGELHQEGRPASKADDVQSAKQLAEEAEKQVKRQDVIDQIVKHIEVKSLQNQTEVAIKLNPEFMGQLKVKLEFKDGGVSASFDTTSALVREMLDESKDELMEAFSGKGIKLSHISVRTVAEEEMA